jgi:hypothetical protein
VLIQPTISPSLAASSPHRATPSSTWQRRDTSPAYFDRYMLDKSHRPTDVQQAAVDRIHYYEQVATHWGNWAKIFFNNKGVVAKATETCADYPQGDMSVWDWRSGG